MLRLAYGPLVIALKSADPAPLAWLDEFLGAAFDRPSPSAPPDRIVRLELGAEAPGAEGASEEVECFSLDGDFVRLPSRRGVDGSLAIRDDKERILYVVRGADVTIRAPADGKEVRLALLRVVRELATAHALGRGQLHLHAAAVEVNGRVAAFAGPRGSGKTTLLLHALLAGGARYVTNDRLFVDPFAEPPRCRGMPTIVSLREETLARFPDFAARLRATAFARDRTLAEAAAMPPGARPNVTPPQLRSLARVDEIAEGPLRAVLFPALAPDVPRFEIRPLEADEAAARLRTGIFLATLPERPAAVFAAAAGPPRDGRELDRLCRALAPRIPCFDIRLGPLAYDPPGVWGAIRERLP